jgi:hypothetical protein
MIGVECLLFTCNQKFLGSAAHKDKVRLFVVEARVKNQEPRQKS